MDIFGFDEWIGKHRGEAIEEARPYFSDPRIQSVTVPLILPISEEYPFPAFTSITIKRSDIETPIPEIYIKAFREK